METPTEKIYYANPYQQNLRTKVIHTQSFRKNTAVILEKTIFYPEGGGEPGDHGFINQIPVINTIEQEGKILHILKTNHAIEPGMEVELELDWGRRFELMQAHTAQHLISAILEDKWEVSTFSVHFSENTFTVDVTLDNPSWNQLEKLERQVNKIIFENHPVSANWMSDKEIGQLKLRNQPKKSGKKGYRIISINNIDHSPCGGMHVNSTGQLGLIKFLKSTKIQGGTRIEYTVGWRSLVDYQEKSRELIKTAQYLKVPQSGVYESVERISNEKDEAESKIKDLEKTLSTYQAKEIYENGKKRGEGTIYLHIFNNMDMSNLRDVMNYLLDCDEKAVILFGNINQEKSSNLLFARSENYLKDDLNISNILQTTAQKLGGNGGGRPSFAQGGGGVKNFENIMQWALEQVEKHML